MFLNMLSTDEKRAFTLLAEQLIEADGIVVGREASALAALKAEMGIGDTDSADRSIEALAGVFTSHRSKIVALLELYGLAYTDTDFESGEASLIATIGHHMGLTSEELGVLDAWVQEHVALVRRALALMRE